MSTILNIRTDAQTKSEITNFASSIGLSASAFVLAVVKQAVREKQVVLRPSLEPTPQLEKIMREADADIKAGNNISKAYSNVEDLFADLDKNND
ncbi:MAG: hypothetical protein PVI21_03000 [Candidatus Woesebacteria bacterium]|jgi:antitoxin component of RelBE/YafQ-DinJ toxin-antitoxin module